MLNFIKRGYRRYAEVWLWLNLITETVVGGVTGHSLGKASYYDDNTALYTFLGIVVGLCFGLGINFIFGGFVATVLAIEENTAKTAATAEETLSVLEKITNADTKTGDVGVGVGNADTTAHRKTTTDNSGGSNLPGADEYGRINYRTWWDKDGGKHESWVDANGTQHET